MPILILHGEDDTLIAEEQARTLAAANAGTRFVSYPDWGHDLAANEAVQDEIRSFLE